MSFSALLDKHNFGKISKAKSVRHEPRSHAEMVSLLEKRGCAFSFDVEGDFFEVGAHARLVKAICALQKLRVKCSDQLIPKKGWLLTLLNGQSKKFFFAEQDAVLSNDFVEWSIVRDAVQEVTLPHDLLLCDLHTEDQIMAVTLIPAKLLAALRKEGLVVEYNPYRGHHNVADKLNIGLEPTAQETKISPALAKRLMLLAPD